MSPAASRGSLDPPRLVLGEQLGRRSAPRLLLKIDVGKSLPVGVADDVASVRLPDGPGRREAAGRGRHICRLIQMLV
jgi:hypothetical protein